MIGENDKISWNGKSKIDIVPLQFQSRILSNGPGPQTIYFVPQTSFPLKFPRNSKQQQLLKYWISANTFSGSVQPAATFIFFIQGCLM